MQSAETFGFEKMAQILYRFTDRYEEITNRLIRGFEGHSNSLFNFSTDLRFLQRLADSTPASVPSPQQQPTVLSPPPPSEGRSPSVADGRDTNLKIEVLADFGEGFVERFAEKDVRLRGRGAIWEDSDGDA